VKAEILESPRPLVTGARIVIDAPASKIFDLLANPRMHPVLDGSGMVRGVLRGPARLGPGAKFVMSMKMGFVPYFVPNTVVEFRDAEVIAWATVSGQIWRYELRAIDANTTEVTEWSDGGSSRFKPAASNNLKWSGKAMAQSLVNLKKAVEGGGSVAR
jgi:hypothetical protein